MLATKGQAGPKQYREGKVYRPGGPQRPGTQQQLRDTQAQEARAKEFSDLKLRMKAAQLQQAADKSERLILQQQLSSMCSRVSELTAQLATESAARITAQSCVTELEMQLAAAQQLTSALACELLDEKSDRAQSQQDCAGLRHELATVQHELRQEKKARVLALQREQQLADALGAAQQQSNSRSAALAEAQQLMQAQTGEVGLLRQQLSAADEARKQLQDERAAAAARIASLIETNQRLLAEQKAATQGWAAEKAAHVSTAAILAYAQQQVQELQRDLAAARAAQHRQQHSAAAALAAMRQERDAWRARFCDANEGRAVVRAELRAQGFVAAKEKGQHVSTQAALAAMAKQHAALTAAAERMQADLQDSTASTAALEQLMHGEKQQHQATASLLATAQQQLLNSQSALQDMQAQLVRQQQAAARREARTASDLAALQQQNQALICSRQLLRESAASIAQHANARAFTADKLAREERMGLQTQLAEQAAQHESALAAITSTAAATAARLQQGLQDAVDGRQKAQQMLQGCRATLTTTQQQLQQAIVRAATAEQSLTSSKSLLQQYVSVTAQLAQSAAQLGLFAPGNDNDSNPPACGDEGSLLLPINTTGSFSSCAGTTAASAVLSGTDYTPGCQGLLSQQWGSGRVSVSSSTCSRANSCAVSMRSSSTGGFVPGGPAVTNDRGSSECDDAAVVTDGSLEVDAAAVVTAVFSAGFNKGAGHKASAPSLSPAAVANSCSTGVADAADEVFWDAQDEFWQDCC